MRTYYLIYISYLIICFSSPLSCQIDKTYRSFPEAIANPDSVFSLIITNKDYKEYSLSIGNTEFSEIPKEVFKFRNLEYLRIAGSNVSNISKKIKKLKNLNWLDLSHNNITKIPKSISSLKKLKILNLSNNKISKLPKHLSKLKNLTRVEFNNNVLEIIPDFFTEFKHLESIKFQRNNIKNFPPFKTIKYVDLQMNQLEKLPIFENNNEMLKLYLGRNQLKEITNNILALSNLEVLDISNNPFDKFPEAIDELTNLQNLYIDGTKFTDFDDIVMEQNFELKRLLKDIKINYQEVRSYGNSPITKSFVGEIKNKNSHLDLNVKTDLHCGFVPTNSIEFNIFDNIVYRDKLNRAHAKNKSLVAMIGSSLNYSNGLQWAYFYRGGIMEYIIVKNPMHTDTTELNLCKQYLVTFISLTSRYPNRIEIMDIYEIHGEIPY